MLTGAATRHASFSFTLFPIFFVSQNQQVARQRGWRNYHTAYRGGSSDMSRAPGSLKMKMEDDPITIWPFRLW